MLVPENKSFWIAFSFVSFTLQQSGILTRKRVKKKRWKLILASNHPTYSMFHNENRANRTFQWVPAVKFLRKSKHVLENDLTNSCTKKSSYSPMVSFVNIEDLKLKIKILSVVKWTKKQCIVIQIYNPFVSRARKS